MNSPRLFLLSALLFAAQGVFAASVTCNPNCWVDATDGVCSCAGIAQPCSCEGPTAPKCVYRDAGLPGCQAFDYCDYSPCIPEPPPPPPPPDPPPPVCSLPSVAHGGNCDDACQCGGGDTCARPNTSYPTKCCLPEQNWVGSDCFGGNGATCSNNAQCITGLCCNGGACGACPPPPPLVNRYRCGGAGCMLDNVWGTFVNDPTCNNSCVAPPLRPLPPPPAPPLAPPPPPAAPPPPISLPPPTGGGCGSFNCGTVYMAETYPGVLRGLRDVVVEFREANGSLIRSTRTNNSGDFQIDPGGRQGYIRIAPGRNQVAWPARIPVKAGDRADFRLMGMRGELEVSGNPGSFVLITTAPWPGNSPAYFAGNPTRAYTATIGTERISSGKGLVTLNVTRGNYYLTCWSSEIVKGKWGYRRVPSIPVGTVEPQFPATPATCK